MASADARVVCTDAAAGADDDDDDGVALLWINAVESDGWSIISWVTYVRHIIIVIIIAIVVITVGFCVVPV